MKTKKLRKQQDDNFKIKVSDTDIINFPVEKMVIDEFWKSLYEGS